MKTILTIYMIHDVSLFVEEIKLSIAKLFGEAKSENLTVVRVQL